MAHLRFTCISCMLYIPDQFNKWVIFGLRLNLRVLNQLFLDRAQPFCHPNLSIRGAGINGLVWGSAQDFPRPNFESKTRYPNLGPVEMVPV